MISRKKKIEEKYLKICRRCLCGWKKSMQIVNSNQVWWPWRQCCTDRWYNMSFFLSLSLSLSLSFPRSFAKVNQTLCNHLNAYSRSFSFPLAYSISSCIISTSSGHWPLSRTSTRSCIYANSNKKFHKGIERTSFGQSHIELDYQSKKTNTCWEEKKLLTNKDHWTTAREKLDISPVMFSVYNQMSTLSSSLLLSLKINMLNINIFDLER